MRHISEILSDIKSLFHFDSKDTIKFFLNKELDDINLEIRNINKYKEILEQKRDRVENMVFGA